MFSFFVGVSEKWGMKDEKNNDKRGGRGGGRSRSILMPEKETEITFVTPPSPHGFINEIMKF